MRTRASVWFVALFVGSLAAQEVKERVTLKGHDDVVTSLAFSPDGKLLAWGCCGGRVKVWDVSRLQR